jgi:hypothetical protein
VGYNAEEIITRFVRNAGQGRYASEPGKRPGAYRQAFPDGSGASLYYGTDQQGRVIEIQSYGDWFPLARLLLHPSGKRKMWLLNGDRWPGPGGFGRTNEHNDMARQHAQASGTPCFIVPFSALRAARIEMETIKPVHVEPETWTQEDHSASALDEVPEGHRKHRVWRDEDGRAIVPPVAEGGHTAQPDGKGGWTVGSRRLGERGVAWYRDPVDGPEYAGELTDNYEDIEPGPDGRYHWTTSRHWLGSSLFRARYPVSRPYVPGLSRKQRNRWAYFVTSFDYNEPRPLWFMSELPRGVKPATVAEAISALKPEVVRDAEAAGIPVLRQGDVFVIQAGTFVLPLDALEGETVEFRPMTERELRALGGELVAWTPPGWGTRGGRFVNDSHTATRVIQMPDGTLFVRGIMRHAPANRKPDHVQLELWDRQTWGRVVFNAQARSIDAQPRSWSMGGDVD